MLCVIERCAGTYCWEITQHMIGPDIKLVLWEGQRQRHRERGRKKGGLDGRVPAEHAHVQCSLGLPGTRIKGMTMHLASRTHEAHNLQMSYLGNPCVCAFFFYYLYIKR